MNALMTKIKTVGMVLPVFVILLSGCPSNKSKEDSDALYTVQIPIDFPLNQLNAYTDISDDRYRVGQGFKTGTYEIVQTAIDTTKMTMETTVPSSQGGGTTVSYEYAEDYSSLKSSMGLNVSLNAKIGWFSTNSSMQSLQSTVQNGLSNFLVATISVSNQTKNLKNPSLTQEAEKLLKKDPVKFYENYGDQFISGIVTGGTIHVIYEFFSTSLEEKKSLAVNVKMKAQSLVNSLQAVVDYTNSLETEHKNKKVKVSIIRVGDKSDLPSDNIDSLLKFIRTFPSKVTPISGNAAFLKFVTQKYTSAVRNSLLAGKQNDMDKLADQQRKVFQLLSWKQELVSEALKSTDFALDSQYFELVDGQKNLLTEGKQSLRKLYTKIDDCYLTCKQITDCEDCKKLIIENVFNPDFSNLKTKTKLAYEFIGRSPISHDESQLAILAPNSKYKLEFSGMLLAPGNIPFEPFVSDDNDQRAVLFTMMHPGGPFRAHAYPVIVLSQFSGGNAKTYPLRSQDKTLLIETKNAETIIRGANRYYITENRSIYQIPVFLTPASGFGPPTVSIYKEIKKQ